MATNLPMLQFEPFIMEDGKKLNLGIRVKGKQDYSCRPQVSREMLPVHCQASTCLSNATLECTSPAKRLPPKTVNEKKFLSIQSLTFILSKNQSDHSMVL